jgi:hypothetical protein
MLAAGGNAVDAAVAALFALTVVEPMMVGILGGGITHLRLPDGSHRIIDGLPTAPAAARPDLYRPVSDTLPSYLDTDARENAVGAKAVAVPGALPSWCDTLERFGTMPLADVMEPAIRHAARGFRITPFLHECIADTAADLAQDAGIARLYLPDSAPLAAGSRLVQGDYAEVRATSCARGRPCCTAVRSAAPWRIISRAQAASSASPTSAATARSSARSCAGAIAASRSSARRRPPRAACTSCRCSTSWRATTSARLASARTRRCT